MLRHCARYTGRDYPTGSGNGFLSGHGHRRVSPVLKINLQGVQVARHHIPEGDGCSEVEDILLPDPILYLTIQVVIDLAREGHNFCGQCQLVEELHGVTK